MNYFSKLLQRVEERQKLSKCGQKIACEGKKSADSPRSSLLAGRAGQGHRRVPARLENNYLKEIALLIAVARDDCSPTIIYDIVVSN